MNVGNIQIISAHLSQFCCEPKLLLKKKKKVSGESPGSSYVAWYSKKKKKVKKKNKIIKSHEKYQKNKFTGLLSFVTCTISITSSKFIPGNFISSSSAFVNSGA